MWDFIVSVFTFLVFLNLIGVFGFLAFILWKDEKNAEPPSDFERIVAFCSLTVNAVLFLVIYCMI